MFEWLLLPVLVLIVVLAIVTAKPKGRTTRDDKRTPPKA
jgi:hypothetical protein